MSHCYIFRGFEAYMKSAPNFNFTIYNQLVTEISETFTKISQDIISIEKQLREPPHQLKDVADFIVKIQEEEERKLAVVSIWVNCDRLSRKSC